MKLINNTLCDFLLYLKNIFIILFSLITLFILNSFKALLQRLTIFFNLICFSLWRYVVSKLVSTINGFMIFILSNEKCFNFVLKKCYCCNLFCTSGASWVGFSQTNLALRTPDFDSVHPCGLHPPSVSNQINIELLWIFILTQVSFRISASSSLLLYDPIWQSSSLDLFLL